LFYYVPKQITIFKAGAVATLIAVSIAAIHSGSLISTSSDAEM
jgi:hypothetical protein